jgi:hypothetical protein
MELPGNCRAVNAAVMGSGQRRGKALRDILYFEKAKNGLVAACEGLNVKSTATGFAALPGPFMSE